MSSNRITASAIIDAPPAEVYRIIADYREKHPQILPRPPFESLEVEKGGFGAGTVIRVTMRVLGRPQAFLATITEPEPGRVLVETNDTGYVTTFTVDPVDGEARSAVTISTEVRRQGLSGAVEGWLAGRLLLPVYRKELEKLATVASVRPG
jgi:uncharacterized protein YndB with AHSA1/START domain